MTDKERPYILLTNDDGIQSPGLRAAATAVAPLGDIIIVAPHRQQTGAGRSFTKLKAPNIYQQTLTLGGQEVIAYSIDTSPARVASIALMDIVNRPVNLVVSGINFGENIGSGVTISGTVGAALEAASQGIPALAVSFETPVEHHLSNSEEVDFSVAAHFTGLFAHKILQMGTLPHDVDILKVEVPASATVTTPWRMTRVSRQPYHISLSSKSDDPKMLLEPGYAVKVNKERIEPDSDIWAMCVDEIIAVSPLSVDLTSRVDLTELQAKFNDSM